MSDLDLLLEDVQVEYAGGWENDAGPADWWAVSTADEGIIAYFAHEEDACRFRLDFINMRLNARAALGETE